jgi:hypothetical protein
MSSLWTPGGEHRVDRGGEEGATEQQQQLPTDAELAALRDQLARTPASVVVANHCLGLWELAALHLSLQPPQLDQAAVAIDALGAVVDRLEGRLGEEEATLRDGLAQLRLAFVQVKAAASGPPSQGDS